MSISIPIYKVNHLISNNKIKTIYVFYGYNYDIAEKKFDEIIKDAARMIGANQNEGCRLPPPRRFGEDSPPPPRP